MAQLMRRRALTALSGIALLWGSAVVPAGAAGETSEPAAAASAVTPSSAIPFGTRWECRFDPSGDLIADDSGELPFWKQQSFIEQLMSAGRWLLVLIVAWLLWRKAIKPQLARREQVALAEVEKAKAQQEIQEAVEVRLSKDEQTQQRRANQRLSAEVMSQRIREMSDNDPRVVALVIRQWMYNDHE